MLPIEGKAPSQVLFNLFFIPAALPIAIKRMIPTVDTIAIANPIRNRDVAH